MHGYGTLASHSPKVSNPHSDREDDAANVDIPTPRGRSMGEVCRWLFAVRASPTQATSKLSPQAFLIWLIWIIALFFTIDRMIPVELVSDSIEGMDVFANQVTFQRLNGESAKLKDVTSLDDVVAYERSLVAALLPNEQYGHQAMQAGDELYVFRVHRLLHSIIVAQRRVSPTDCAYPEMKEIYPHCYGELTEETEMKTPLPRLGGGAPHEYDPVLEAYLVQLPLDHSNALQGFDQLVRERFWDRVTRQSSIRFVIHNANGHYSGYGMVSFGFSPYGLVTHDVAFDFLRLQPYAEEVHGNELLAIQIGTLSLLLVIAVIFLHGAITQPHVRWSLAYLLRPWAIADYLTFWLSFCCVFEWLKYMDSPFREAEVDAQDSSGFQSIAALSVIFRNVTFYLSMLILVSTLRLLEYMVLVRQLRHTYVAVSNAMVDIGWFGLMFCVVFGGFVLSGHVLFGAQVPMFSELGLSASHLMLWLLTLGGGQARLLELPGGWIFLPMFLFVCLVLIFNILLALLLGSFENMEEKEDECLPGRRPWEERPINHRIADGICDCIGVSPFRGDPYAPAPSIKNADETASLLDPSTAAYLSKPPRNDGSGSSAPAPV